VTLKVKITARERVPNGAIVGSKSADNIFFLVTDVAVDKDLEALVL
jgi:hypothetical protein